MTQEQNKPVRSREDQANLILNISEAFALNQEAPTTEFVLGQLEEAEARGAAEQRRKDAEGQEMRRENALLRTAISTIASYAGGYAKPTCTVEFLDHAVPEEVRLRVAALEARVKALAEENITLKTRVINAAENLLSIETPCMKGDNFAVTICSHFEDCEGETCDNGWHEGATKAYEEIKDAVLQHFRAALTREGGV